MDGERIRGDVEGLMMGIQMVVLGLRCVLKEAVRRWLKRGL